MLWVKFYPAGNGDAFLLKAEGTDTRAVLVDGGYAATYRNAILPDLRTLAANGFALDLVVATHVDADHVSGLLPFFRENGDASNPKIIPVRRVFHNSLRSIAPTVSKPVPESSDDDALLQEIERRGFPLAAGEGETDHEISARQGSSLAKLLRAAGYLWNQQDGKQSINGDGLSSFELGPNTKVTVIGPSLARLERLRKWWISEIRRLGYTGALDANDRLDDAFEYLCADAAAESVAASGEISLSVSDELKDCYLPDDSVTNGSSISLIVESDSTRALLLGDSWAEDTEIALRYLKPNDGRIIFDAIKVSHHGSVRNTSPSLLDLIDAPVFFVSSSGEGHNHPDFPVLKAIVDRGAEFPRTMVFNYSTPASQRLRSYSSGAGVKFEVREGAVDWIPISRSRSS
jgi:hypothetical protein